MAKLNLCIMVHVEDTFYYNQGLAAQYALLGTILGNRGARMSWQFDVNYFKVVADGGTYPDNVALPTSLTYLLTNTHNFWVQNHCTTFEHLTTTWARVSSAFERERGSVAANPTHVIGRSGGAKLNGASDWVSITLHAGLRAMNAPTQRNYDYTPQSLRPMGYSDAEILKLHGHERAPGSTNEASGASLWPHQHPIWMDTASRWDAKANTITACHVGSVVMLPSPANHPLHQFSDARNAFPVTPTLTNDDLNAALTQVWSTYQTATQLNSVTNIWYVHLTPAYCLTPYHAAVEGWVRSVNQIMTIGGGGTPRAQWRNMNEITSLAFDTTSRWGDR
jgi:hypothetical protein